MIADKILSTISAGFGMVFQGIRKTLVDTFGLVTSYHNESMKFARSAGMSLQQAHAYTKVLTTRAAELGQKYGLAASEVQNLERNLQNAVSRQLMLSDEQAEKMVQINKLVGEGVSSTYSEQMITKMGAQIDTVQGAIAKAYATAAKSGLNAEKMTQKISQNLSMANRLSFRNGIDGLTRMAMLSEKMGINMQSVESAAGNFMELDKAIENAAHLQMLGGSAGAMFGNPLTAAYEANYDPEAFAKRMSDSLASYATFDASKGISNINGMNMDFVRNIAKAMGISAEEAASMAKKQAEVRYKENTYGTALDAMSGGDQMKRDMLINKSTIQNGKLGMVDSKQQWHEMSYYQSGEGKKEMDMMMSMYGKSDSEIMRDIATTEKTIEEQLRGIWTSITGKIADVFNKFDVLPKIQKFIDEKGAMLVEYVAKGVDWLLNGGFTKWWEDKWKWAQNAWDTAKKWGTGIAAVLGVIAAWKIGKGALGLVRGASAGVSRGGGMLGRFGRWMHNGGGDPTVKTGSWGQKLGSGHKIYSDVYKFNRGIGMGKWSSFKDAASHAWHHSSSLSKAAGVAGVAVGALQGLGAVSEYNAKKEEINNSNMSEAEKAKAIDEIRTDKNSQVGGAIGSSVGTLLGTFFFGPLGGMIGGAVGQFAGQFIGKYWTPIVDTVKKGASKLWDGMKWLWGKLGDVVSIIWKYNPLSIVVSSFKKLREYASGIPLIGGLFKDKEEKKPKKYATGGIVTGGTPGRDSVRALLTPGERVLTNDQYQALVRPKPTGAKEYIYNPGNTSVSNVNGNKITVKDFNINISGTIKIDAGNNFANIDAASLLRDVSFVNQLKNVIKESINNDMNGGRLMVDLATRRGQTSSTSLVGKL